MSEPELPPELRRIEAELAARRTRAGGDSLRLKILSAARREKSARFRRFNYWHYAAAAAAAVVLWINLSMSAANDTGLQLGSRSSGNASSALAQVREILPELGEEEARREVLILRARSNLVKAPRPQGHIQTGSSMEGL